MVDHDKVKYEWNGASYIHQHIRRITKGSMISFVKEKKTYVFIYLFIFPNKINFWREKKRRIKIMHTFSSKYNDIAVLFGKEWWTNADQISRKFFSLVFLNVPDV